MKKKERKTSLRVHQMTVFSINHMQRCIPYTRTKSPLHLPGCYKGIEDGT